MHYAVLIARFLLGAPFVFFGLNHFFAWIEPPVEDLPAAALAFLDAQQASGYMMPLVGGAQVIGGAMVLSGLFLAIAYGKAFRSVLQPLRPPPFRKREG